MFRRLGVFAGGCTMQTAQAVAADGALDEWAVLDHLSALIEKSLVVADAGATPRYRLLESARAFALEQLAAANETPATLKRHAQAMAQWLQSVDDRNMDGELRTDQYAALVPPELDNLRAAYAWATGEAADTALAIRLAAHAGSLIDYAGECAGWLLPWQRRGPRREHRERGALRQSRAGRDKPSPPHGRPPLGDLHRLDHARPAPRREPALACAGRPTALARRTEDADDCQRYQSCGYRVF